MEPTDRIAIRGVSSPIYACGDARRDEAVVFVHGNPGASEDWFDLLPQVGAFARAIAVDMPGYGKADRSRDFNYTVEGYAAHLDGLIDALGLKHLHLVLHDFGGPWGLRWAAGHAARVRSLSLVNVGILPGYRWHYLARVWRTPLLGELFQLSATRSGLRFQLNADNPKPLPRAFTDRIYDGMDWAQKRAVLKLYRATSPAAIEALASAAAATLAPLQLPALVIWGERDAYVPVRFAAVQNDYFKAEVHTLPGCGHWPMVDEPDTFAALLLPFLRRQFGVA